MGALKQTDVFRRELSLACRITQISPSPKRPVIGALANLNARNDCFVYWHKPDNSYSKPTCHTTVTDSDLPQEKSEMAKEGGGGGGIRHTYSGFTCTFVISVGKLKLIIQNLSNFCVY